MTLTEHEHAANEEARHGNREALDQCKALVAAKLHEAAEACTYVIKNYDVMKPDGKTYEPMRVQKAAKGMVRLAREDILALIDTDAQAALDAVRAEAEQRGYANAMEAERKDADSRIEALQAENREQALQILTTLGQAQDAYEAQLKAEAERDRLKEALVQIADKPSEMTWGEDSEVRHTMESMEAIAEAALGDDNG
ncbi:hypothetical protein [Roseovarius indicus]|uniref:Uncharacterized protein n=1 Tax=Roseovarius indicus TaxID=540747 RepID=A0A0T5P8Y3_9RHOB|nr:hypothetical protein [Roseovarius indicus]KRS17500.1 hypothetical protein XM52_13535 [Roseovarius indicus]QEW26696.1 hypothetical protein RIdsm_02498 [Roseovarius indicus]SFD61513.1 hypothetical protein SAMN04488031_101844 [Roseovarius indicus]